MEANNSRRDSSRPGSLRLQIIAAITALQFLTLIPPIIKRAFTDAELGKSVGYFPVAGAFLGAALAGINALLELILPPGVSAVILLMASVCLTGALHLDGLTDALDGLLGGYTPERRLEIMKDENIGAFGMAGGVLALLLKWATLTALHERTTALLLAFTLSRWAISLVLVCAPYARSEGLGRTMKDQSGKAQVVIASGIAIAIAFMVSGWFGLAMVGGAALIAWLWTRFVLSRIPGMTGDTYGATSEWVETVVLLGCLVGGAT